MAPEQGSDCSVHGSWRFIGNAVPVAFIGMVCVSFIGSRWLVRGRISLVVLSLLVALPAKRRDNFRSSLAVRSVGVRSFMHRTSATEPFQVEV